MRLTQRMIEKMKTSLAESVVYDDSIPDGTNILQIDVPPELDKEIDSGLPFMNDILGGYMTPSFACLLTGEPGAGKSTLMQTLADACTRMGHMAFLNTTEEAAVQVRKAVRRLKLTNGFIIGTNRLMPDVLNHAKVLHEVAPEKQMVMILDSLQTHDDGKYANGHVNANSQVRVAEQIKNFCKHSGFYPIVFIVGQVTKGGVFAGKNEVKHLVDGHIHISVVDDEDSPFYGQRKMEVEKNRFGPAGLVTHLELKGAGFTKYRHLYSVGGK